MLIPSELALLKQWCYAAKNKAPKIKVNEIDKALTLSELDYENNTVGIILTGNNEYSIIDVDAPKETKALIASGYSVEDALISKLPKGIRVLIESTYSEYSVSGTGVHIVVKLDKGRANPYNKAYIKAAAFQGQISFTNNFMIMTGNKLDKSPRDIRELTTSEVDELMELFAQQKDIEQEQNLPSMDILPTIQNVEKALNVCPLDQNARVKEVYKAIIGAEYEHYNYWLIISMALHDYGVRSGDRARMYSLFLNWSITDTEAFTGEADCEAKWKSFSQQENSITYKTLFKFAALLEFEYPRQQLSKSGKKTGVPINVEYVNFEYLINKFNIKLFEEDQGSYYLQGDADILEKYFEVQGARYLLGYLGPMTKQQLCGATLRLCQDCRYRNLSSTANLVDTWLTLPRGSVDFFNKWLDTPFEDLPQDFKFDLQGNYLGAYDENSTFEYLCSCIDWNVEAQDPDLSIKMLYKTFMQLIKFHEPLNTTFDDNGGMLAFIGPENTYKTTFFKMLLPKPLSFLRKELNMPTVSDKGMRDFVRYLSKKAIVQIDEFEGFLDQKKTGPILKAIISGNNMSMTDIYQTADTQMERKAIIVATSNERRHIISANGSRRLWLCEVNKVDTMKLLKFNWHTFYNRMRVAFKLELAEGKLPWLLDFADTKATTRRNENLAAKTDLDLALEMAFGDGDYFTSLDESLIMSSAEVLRTLWNYDIRPSSLAALDRALERYCSKYTAEAGRYQAYKGVGCVLEKGRLVIADDGRRELRLGRTKRLWVLPKLED